MQTNVLNPKVSCAIFFASKESIFIKILLQMEGGIRIKGSLEILLILWTVSTYISVNIVYIIDRKAKFLICLNCC